MTALNVWKFFLWWRQGTVFVTVQTDLGYAQVWRSFYYRASQQITLLKNKKYITGGGGALQCSTTIPANMEEKVKDPSCWGDIMIALMHQGYPGHLALFCEMWKLWLGEKVSPYLEKNPTHHHPSQIWPLHSKWSVISVTEKSKAGGNFLSKKNAIQLQMGIFEMKTATFSQ